MTPHIPQRDWSRDGVGGESTNFSPVDTICVSCVLLCISKFTIQRQSTRRPRVPIRLQ